MNHESDIAAEVAEGYVHPQAIVEGAEIGEATRVWAFAHVMPGASVGKGCNIGEGCFVEADTHIGDHVTLKNGVAVWSGVSIEDYAFIGPHAVFTNDLYPRAWIKPPRFQRTRVGLGVTVGANATIICGITLGPFSMVGGGSVVTMDTRPLELVAGNPAEHIGWVCVCGQRLKKRECCGSCGAEVLWKDGVEPSIDENSSATWPLTSRPGAHRPGD
jgi:tetrahydrodipicolinate N-succinyltransferase